MKDINRQVDKLEIKGTTIVLKRNFSGISDEFNPNGKRLFNLKLDPELAEILNNDGWAVKAYQKDENEEPLYFLKVEVKYNHYENYEREVAESLSEKYNPKIYIVIDNKKALLDETNIRLLDKMWIKSVDVKINPYPWVIGSKSGIKAYLEKMYVMVQTNDDMGIKEDPFDTPYADIPEGEIDASQW